MKLRLTWSRWAANPSEHIADLDKYFPQPICGAPLDAQRQTFGSDGDLPTGLAPVCKKCATRLAQFPVVKPGFRRNEILGITIEQVSGEWVANEILDGGRENWISTQKKYFDAARDALNYAKQKSPAVKAVLDA